MVAVAADIDRMGFAVGDIRVRIFPDGADVNLNIADETVGYRLGRGDGLIWCDDRSRSKAIDCPVDAGDLHRSVGFGFSIRHMPRNDIGSGRRIAVVIARNAHIVG